MSSWDMLDIEAVVAAQEHLDTGRIALWVQQFADLLEMPQLGRTWRSCCARRRPERFKSLTTHSPTPTPAPDPPPHSACGPPAWPARG